jgi:hypothetical protein
MAQGRGVGLREHHVDSLNAPIPPDSTYVPSMYHIKKKILRSSGIKTVSVSEMAKGYPPGLRLLYSSGFERQPSRFDGMHALDR